MSKNEDGLDHIRIPFEKLKFGNKLEVQGYGTIYEGEFDDQKVALKRLNITNLANIKQKLLDEILTISEFRHHPNLVALLGFCDEKSNEIILVYEFVGSGNLADKMRKRLNTIQRLEICLGAARGLEYLHTGVEFCKSGIVHGHIKPSKILLNSNNSKFEAKVSSFGLSKIVPGQASIKSIDDIEKPTKEADVYDFGVLLLEVLCGVSELVDTDDYHEKHVTELVPKRLEQDIVRKVVHFDIRKEFKMEALETYAKIACQCVVENVEARPSMGQVVKELEKALRLQGGEVSYVEIFGSKKITDAQEEIVVDEYPNDVNNSVPVNSNVDVNSPFIEENVNDLITNDKLDGAGEDNGNEINIVDATSDSTNGEKNTSEDVTTDERNSVVPLLDSVDGESVSDEIKLEQEENIEQETTNGSNSNEKSNVVVEDIEDAQKEISNIVMMSTNDPDTTEEIKDDLNSNQKSNFRETEDDSQSIKLAITSESSNIDASTSDQSTNQELQNTAILESGSRDFNNLQDGNYDEENVDELEHLRIPFEKIKIGKKMDVRGYGSMFEGEFNDQQVALKRLNMTNLDNIKPKLLSEILTISKFRQHPNVVALIGFCDEKSNEIILVYEHVSSGNLADKMSKHLNTIQRLEICLGSARGLEYLHTDIDESTPAIIHGDVKLSKILLNSDSKSSKFEAKVSSYGLSKLLPGYVQLAQKSTKEYDVYSFGVLLLEVLRGVPELVDTDDYQERHVIELVPKRLEQNMLRKIVHFDIRNEIKTECLETYAKIACRCVMKEPEDRPTMSEVVIELEKALRLQGGELEDIQILGSGNGNGLSEETEDQDVQGVEDNAEKMSSDIADEEPKPEETVDEDLAEKELEPKIESIEKTVDEITTIEQSSDIPILGGEDSENVPEEITQTEDIKQENGENNKDITIDQKSNDEPKITGEDEIDRDSKIVTSSESNNDTKEKGKDGPDNNEIMDDKHTTIEITMVQEVQEPPFLDSDNTNAEKHKRLLNTGKKPEMIVNIRDGDFSDFATQNNLLSAEKTKEAESKRSNSTCSESSNGDISTPSDYLLPKSPTNGTTIVKKTSDNSRNCCSCSWWRYISNRIVFYGGQFWNKLVGCFGWIGGRCSSKRD